LRRWGHYFDDETIRSAMRELGLVACQPRPFRPNLRRCLGAVGVLTCWFVRNARRNVVTNLLDFGVIWR
jgi:hypothetical protein